MTINKCLQCGSSVRLRVMRVSFNRKKGVAQWFERKDGEKCPCLKDWAWSIFKPYEKNPSVFDRKAAEWNELNPKNEHDQWRKE